MKRSERTTKTDDEAARTAAYRQADADFAHWAAGCGVIAHRRVATPNLPEPFSGVIWPLFSQAGRTAVLGYINRGGTLDPCGMPFANGCTWAHVVAAAGLGDRPEGLLSQEEFDALSGRADPAAIIAHESRDAGRLSRTA